MNRRQLLVATGAGALGGLSGCITGRDAVTPGNDDGDQSSTPEQIETDFEYPDHPSALDNQSVREYVAEYEEAYLTEGLQRHDFGTVTCDAELPIVNYETENRWYVTVNECWEMWGSNGREGSVGEGTSGSVLYLVTAETLVRIEPDKMEHDDPYITDDQISNDADGVWLSNFDDVDHELALEITHQNQESDTVLARTFDLPSQSGIHLTKVAGISGEYEYYVDLAAGQQATETFTDASSYAAVPLIGATVVTPEGDLIVDELEFERAL